MLGRVAGVVEMLSVVGIAAGSFGAAMLAHALGARTAILITGVLIPVVVVLRRRAYARMDAGGDVDEHAYALLRSHPIFAPLPVASVELLARDVERIEAGAGEEIVRQGEVGDRFYVIERGELAVFVDGTQVRTMGPGDGFGEIALLHQGPRTATVRATDGAALLALDHQHFLGAVAGLSRSQRIAERVSEERLAWAAPRA